MKAQVLRLVFLVALLVAPAASHGALVLSYSITNNSIGSGFASGSILDSTNTIGSWSITNFSFTTRTTNSVPPYAPIIGTITPSTTDNSYGKPGIGIRIIGDGLSNNGVMSIQYTVGWTLDAGYTLDSASFWGKYPGTVAAYGPAFPTNSGGSISLSGFSGFGTVSDPTDVLLAADGYQFTSGEDLNGWNGPTSKTAANTQWQLTAPSASSYTFILDYDGQPMSAANEATAFNLNISPAAGVPEPGTWAAGALLMAGGALWQYRRRRAA